MPQLFTKYIPTTSRLWTLRGFVFRLVIPHPRMACLFSRTAECKGSHWASTAATHPQGWQQHSFVALRRTSRAPRLQKVQEATTTLPRVALKGFCGVLWHTFLCRDPRPSSEPEHTPNCEDTPPLYLAGWYRPRWTRPSDRRPESGLRVCADSCTGISANVLAISRVAFGNYTRIRYTYT